MPPAGTPERDLHDAIHSGVRPAESGNSGGGSLLGAAEAAAEAAATLAAGAAAAASRVAAWPSLGREARAAIRDGGRFALHPLLTALLSSHQRQPRQAAVSLVDRIVRRHARTGRSLVPPPQTLLALVRLASNTGAALAPAGAGAEEAGGDLGLQAAAGLILRNIASQEESRAVLAALHGVAVEGLAAAFGAVVENLASPAVGAAMGPAAQERGRQRRRSAGRPQAEGTLEAGRDSDMSSRLVVGAVLAGVLANMALNADIRARLIAAPGCLAAAATALVLASGVPPLHPAPGPAQAPSVAGHASAPNLALLSGTLLANLAAFPGDQAAVAHAATAAAGSLTVLHVLLHVVRELPAVCARDASKSRVLASAVAYAGVAISNLASHEDELRLAVLNAGGCQPLVQLLAWEPAAAEELPPPVPAPPPPPPQQEPPPPLAQEEAPSVDAQARIGDYDSDTESFSSSQSEPEAAGEMEPAAAGFRLDGGIRVHPGPQHAATAALTNLALHRDCRAAILKIGGVPCLLGLVVDARRAPQDRAAAATAAAALMADAPQAVRRDMLATSQAALAALCEVAASAAGPEAAAVRREAAGALLRILPPLKDDFWPTGPPPLNAPAAVPTLASQLVVEEGLVDEGVAAGAVRAGSDAGQSAWEAASESAQLALRAGAAGATVAILAAARASQDARLAAVGLTLARKLLASGGGQAVTALLMAGPPSAAAGAAARAPPAAAGEAAARPRPARLVVLLSAFMGWTRRPAVVAAAALAAAGLLCLASSAPPEAVAAQGELEQMRRDFAAEGVLQHMLAALAAAAAAAGAFANDEGEEPAADGIGEEQDEEEEASDDLALMEELEVASSFDGDDDDDFDDDEADVFEGAGAGLHDDQLHAAAAMLLRMLSFRTRAVQDQLLALGAVPVLVAAAACPRAAAPSGVVLGVLSSVCALTALAADNPGAVATLVSSRALERIALTLRALPAALPRLASPGDGGGGGGSGALLVTVAVDAVRAAGRLLCCSPWARQAAVSAGYVPCLLSMLPAAGTAGPPASAEASGELALPLAVSGAAAVALAALVSPAASKSSESRAEGADAADRASALQAATMACDAGAVPRLVSVVLRQHQDAARVAAAGDCCRALAQLAVALPAAREAILRPAATAGAEPAGLQAARPPPPLLGRMLHMLHGLRQQPPDLAAQPEAHGAGLAALTCLIVLAAVDPAARLALGGLGAPAAVEALLQRCAPAVRGPLAYFGRLAEALPTALPEALPSALADPGAEPAPAAAEAAGRSSSPRKRRRGEEDE